MSFTISLTSEDEKLDFEEFFSYATEMMLFQRLLQRESKPAIATQITALWMWFQNGGFGEKLTLKIVENDDEELFNSLAVESMAMLAILDPCTKTPFSPDLFPSSATLLSPNLEALSEIFNECKETVLAQIEKLCKELIVSAFNDFEKRKWHTSDPEDENADEEEEEKKEEEEEEEKNPNEIDNGGEKASEEGDSNRPFALNPNAEEWSPEENRCLFLTFSNGYPLSELQIINFLTRKYGPCIQRVYVHHPGNPTGPPLFGKVVFTTASTVATVLGGDDDAKFVVNRRPLWCKKYEPRRARLPAADPPQEN